MTGELEGKTALVIGASGGIGRASAQALGAQGARVVVADLGDTARDTAASLILSGAEAYAASVDAAEEDAVRRVIEDALSRFGRLDVLHYNAAALSPEQQKLDRDVIHLDAETWDRALNVNVRGAMFAAKHAIPHMIEGDGGSIIFSGSGRGLLADVRSTAYGVSKAALHQLAKYIATQYGKQNIRCNALAIGVVMTEAATRTLPDEIRAALLRNHLTPELGVPQDIADAVVFLASSKSAFITGSVITIDGGFTAHVGVN